MAAQPLGYPQPFSVGPDGCSGKTLAPGASCAITITFAPQSPGDWAGGMYAFAGPAGSSVLGDARFEGWADLSAGVSSPGQQRLQNALRRGLRAYGKCSSACTLTVKALARASGIDTRTLIGTAISHLRRRGSVSFTIHIPSHQAPFLSREVSVELLSSASATSYANGSRQTLVVKLRTVRVKLSATSNR